MWNRKRLFKFLLAICISFLVNCLFLWYLQLLCINIQYLKHSFKQNNFKYTIRIWITCYVLSTVLGMIHISPNLILSQTPQGKYFYYLHLINDDPEGIWGIEISQGGTDGKSSLALYTWCANRSYHLSVKWDIMNLMNLGHGKYSVTTDQTHFHACGSFHINPIV